MLLLFLQVVFTIGIVMFAISNFRFHRKNPFVDHLGRFVKYLIILIIIWFMPGIIISNPNAGFAVGLMLALMFNSALMF